MSWNRVQFDGRLTRDPEVRFAGDGLAIVSGGIACDDRQKVAGEWVKKPVFVDYVMFGKRAEAFAKHHKKGDPVVFASAKLTMDQWEDKQTGQSRTKLKLKVDEWEFASGGRSQTESTTAPASSDDPAPAAPAEESPF